MKAAGGDLRVAVGEAKGVLPIRDDARQSGGSGGGITVNGKYSKCIRNIGGAITAARRCLIRLTP